MTARTFITMRGLPEKKLKELITDLLPGDLVRKDKKMVQIYGRNLNHIKKRYSMYIRNIDFIENMEDHSIVTAYLGK